MESPRRPGFPFIRFRFNHRAREISGTRGTASLPTLNTYTSCAMAVLTAILLAGSSCSRVPPPPSQTQADFDSVQLQDLDGRAVNPLRPGITNASVFLFVSTDCPISNRYAPEIRRLHEKYAVQGVKFWLVYPHASESAEMIRKHVKEFQLPCEALRDLQHVLVKRVQPRVTPEAAVIVPGSRLVYRGRIDDRFADLATERPAPVQRDLLNVLEAIVTGKTVAATSTVAVGCYISAD